MTNNKPEIRFDGFTYGWKQHKLGDFYFFKNGLNKGKEFFGNGTPIVNFTDVFHNRGIYFSKLKGRVNLSDDEIKNYEVKKGDIFFTRTSETIEEIGYPSVMIDEPHDTVFSGFVLRGRAINEEPLEINFKRYVFFTENFRGEMKKKSSMTTRALTSGTALKEMLFHFPESTEEQERIGLFLKKLDDTIALHQCKYEKLINLKKAMLQKMFPQSGKSIPEIRFKGFTDDWEQHKLGDKVNFYSGLTYSPDSIVDTGTLVLRSSNVKNGELVSADNVYVNPEVVNSQNVEVGDVIVVVRNGSRNLIGKHACVKKKMDNTVIGAFMTGIRSEVPSFTNALLDSNQFSIEINKNIGATINQITTGEFKKMEFAFPSQEEQKQIGDFFEEIDKIISLHTEQLNKLQQIKKSMLKKLFI